MTRELLLILYGSLAAAQHVPVGVPSGNPFSRPSNEIVSACKPFTITWQPTTSNNISLVLLRGPADNVKPVSTIITRTANSGSYVWFPGSALEADATNYGLQLIDDVTGQYQYSTQFGIAKEPDCDSPASSRSLTSSSLSAITSSTPSAAASDRPQDTSSRGPKAMKPGIAAAIGIGATVGVAFFALAVFMAYRLGRRRDNLQQEDAVASDTDTKVEYLKPELHAQSVGELHGQHVMHELHGSSAVINEMASPATELHNEATRKELDGAVTPKEDD
ncbi:Ser-Thr-rich glycosyl-phosphatidyl-inositol-anchored membrane family-domain-containing protein [Phaeosphaeria sp. MPI-PUGE-AT-0046c]|nr:Ser-Thr-rich glycosyl-phosphatidyl-inositol-anchored membrane family-domain-containing protein [Phaeosphaeria sp. MPI-PUGE-AT-0046c]